MEFASPAIAKEINYIRNVEENMKKLKRKRDELACVEKDVRKDVANAAKWKAKKPKEEVNNWLKNVKEVENETSEMEKVMEEESKCLMGYLPNIRTLRKIGKRSLELIEEVDDLLNKRSFEGGVIASTPPTTTQILPTTSLVGSTAKQNFKLIWNLLKEENTGIIGIYGMGGVGKTTVMKNINNHLEFKKRFDIVIWVTVSKDFNLKRLRSVIAKRLYLPEDLDEESLSIELHEALRRKKFLLVLDDVWDRISLELVGIPEPRNGCKLVLTTRSHRVCELMEANTFIKIKELSEEEAWSLFKEKVGATTLVDSNVQVVAKQVADECKGLPLALITVGRALRGISDVGRWRHALRQLKNSKPEIGDMEDEVFTKLCFSYQYLKSDNLRACFLYCSLFPEDYTIIEYELIYLWIGEGFIEEHGDTQAMLDKGKFILNELVEACMLERSDGRGYYGVKMHDLMRDMAIDITRNSPIFIVKSGIGLEKVVVDKEWVEDVERISLMRNMIKMLSGEPPKCPKLVTLFLNDNPISHFESHSFFQHMNQLRVLDLSETAIEELPESISSLENLHMLKLRYCRKLKTIPSLAKLKELRLLDLSSTWIEELPKSFSDLENLYELQANHCRKLNTIPSLAKLKKLRTLYLSYTSIEVLPDSLSGLEKLNKLYLGGCEKLKCVPSLAKLKNLKTLDLSFTCIDALPQGMEALVELRLLKLENTKRLRWFPIEILPRLSLLEYFQMQGSSFLWPSSSSNEIRNLSRLVDVSFDFADISSFRKYAASMQGLIAKLETFQFRVAKSNTHNSIGDFIFLFTLYKRRNELIMSIEQCEEEDMKTGLPQFLLDLGIMEVAELVTRCEIKTCKGMEWLLVAHDYNNYSVHRPLLLSQVSFLQIKYMPDLRALHKGTLLHATLANLQKLIITECPKLKNPFSLGTLQSLQNLEVVEIINCSAMEEVVAGEEDGKTGFSAVITLPNLKAITLYKLPALKSFCTRTMVCSSLTEINIALCCRLKKIPLVIGKPPPTGFTAELRGTREWWDALDWDDLAHTKNLLKSFFTEREESSSSEEEEIEDKYKEELQGKSDKLGEKHTVS